ncbi:MAG: BlaI/MecI/CopY family transcriptional regulator [Rubripirellula sp.]
MARKAQDVTEAELAILEQLWAEGPLSVKVISTTLYGEATTSTTATVQKLLGRLESKECVSRDPTVWPRLFRASIDRADLISRRLQNTADELCEGSLGPLLTHLVKSSVLSRSDRSKLQSMLDEASGNGVAKPSSPSEQ